MSYARAKAAEARQRGDEARAEWWLRVAARVDQAPSLTAQQCAQLRILLHS